MNTQRLTKFSASSLAIAVASALLVPGAALAQQAPAEDGGLAEIIVTASKRATNLQKESRAVSVVDATTLERASVVDPTAVQNLVAGVNITPNGQQMQIYIRGVGDQTINATTDPAVAVNVDGVYFPRAYQASTQFFDLERVEVLKGPQGTLYGRNASAGAMNLISARPKFEFGGFIEGEYGNFDSKRLAGAVNLPFTDKVALRLAGQIIDREGYLTDGYNDAKSEALRASLLIQASPQTSLLITGSYAHQGGMGSSSVLLPNWTSANDGAVSRPTNPWAGPTDPATIARIQYTNPGATIHLYDPTKSWMPKGFVDAEVYSLSANFEHQFAGATLTIMPSYVGSRLKTWITSAVTVPSYDDAKSDQMGLETRLSSPAGSRHKWVVGAMAMHEDGASNYQSWIPIGASLLQVTEAPQRDDTTLGLFGEANIALTDQFRAILGGRYTWEKKVVEGVTDSAVGTFGAMPAPYGGLPPLDIRGRAINSPTALDVSGQRTDKAFNFRAGVEYDLSPDSMAYATVATGFKAGGFYNDVAGANSYKPEKLTAYTAGIKNRFLNNNLQVNLEAFYWDYTDKQETFLGPLSINPESILLITSNAASAEIYGAELTTMFKLSEHDVLSGDVTYTHATYGKFETPLLGGGVSVSTGKPLMRAPEWAGRVSYERTQPLGGNLGELILNASMRFSSKYWLTNTYTPAFQHPSYQVFDASLTWQSPAKTVSITGFMKNIGDKAYYTGGIWVPTPSDGLGQIAAPRTYGVRAKINF